MNFLGHLFFSNNDVELMYANLLGDFIKGKDLSSHPQIIQEGIRLHRTIDDYIDHHPIIIELLHSLYKDLPKVSGIAVDLYFDYLLATNWEKYSPTSLTDFINEFENAHIDRSKFDNAQFWIIIDRMKKGNWLHHSNSMYGLRKSSEGVSRIITFPNVLGKAPEVFKANQTKIEDVFARFMDEAIPFFDTYFENKST